MRAGGSGLAGNVDLWEDDDGQYHIARVGSRERSTARGAVRSPRQAGGRTRLARHRERTGAHPLVRRPRHSTTQKIRYVNGTDAAVSDDYPVAARAPELIRQGNEAIRAAVRTQGGQTVPFFCECSDATCDQALWLALADYDRHAQTGEPILVDEHAC